MAIKPEFLCTIHGKQVVMVGGLLDAAHSAGLIGIETELVEKFCQPEKDRWVVQATGTFETEGGRRVWTAYGDADGGNSQMKGALLRHAETRAIARMLRFATNCAMVAAEELGGDEDVQPRPTANTTRAPVPNGPAAVAAPGRARVPAERAAVSRPVASEEARSGAGWEGPSDKCSFPGCGMAITHNNEVMSLAKFRRPLCLEHMTALKNQQPAV